MSSEFSSSSITNIAPALLKVQQALKPITKDEENPFLKNRYTSLSSVLETVRPILTENDLVLIQRGITEKPDVLLLDAVLPQMDGVEVLEKLNIMGLSDGIRIIVMSPFNDDELVEQLQQLGALYVVHLPAIPETVFNRIVDFAIADDSSRRIGEENKEEKRRELRDKVVSNYFHGIGAPANLRGYQYARAAIIYCVDNYGSQHYVTKEVYPYVAAQYNATPKQVERNIRTFIEATWSRGDIEKLNKLFGYTVSQHKGRPTNKEFIALLTERSVMRLRQG